MKNETPEYRSWRNMRQRCLNTAYPKYAAHGGRGITICPEWDSFEQFLLDMGPRPEGKTLERENNDGNYEPGNCTWATPTEQANNRRKRKDSSRPDGVEVVVRKSTYSMRVARGWSPELAASTPAAKRSK